MVFYEITLNSRKHLLYNQDKFKKKLLLCRIYSDILLSSNYYCSTIFWEINKLMNNYLIRIFRYRRHRHKRKFTHLHLCLHQVPAIFPSCPALLFDCLLHLIPLRLCSDFLSLTHFQKREEEQKNFSNTIRVLLKINRIEAGLNLFMYFKEIFKER